MSKKAPVFVTGCDTGFGPLLVLKLIQNGINTFAGCFTEQGEIDLRRATVKGPGKLWTVRLDVTDQSSVDKALEFVKEELGPGKGLWALVNNAGVPGAGAPDDWSKVDDYEKAMAVNCFGIIRMTHAFKPLLKKERGRVIVITSLFGRVAGPTCGPYSVSKYAAEGYCDVARRGLKPFGVTVHILEPGFFATNVTKPSLLVSGLRNLWEKQPTEVQEEYGEDYLKQAIHSLENKFAPMLSTRLDKVVDTYYHAIVSTRPNRRYHIGADMKLFWIPLSHYPTRLQDAIYAAVLKLKGDPEPKAAI